MLHHHIRLYIVGRNVNQHLIDHQNQQNMVKKSEIIKNHQLIKINLDDIKTWLRQVEDASSNAVETVFPRSSGRQTGKILANQAAAYAKTTDTTYTGK
jgi:hypothetical protein